MKLALAPLEEILREQGGQRVSRLAVEEFRDAVEEYAQALAEVSVAMAHHAGRKTVKANDIKIAIK